MDNIIISGLMRMAQIHMMAYAMTKTMTMCSVNGVMPCAMMSMMDSTMMNSTMMDSFRCMVMINFAMVDIVNNVTVAMMVATVMMVIVVVMMEITMVIQMSVVVNPVLVLSLYLLTIWIDILAYHFNHFFRAHNIKRKIVTWCRNFIGSRLTFV